MHFILIHYFFYLFVEIMFSLSGQRCFLELLLISPSIYQFHLKGARSLIYLSNLYLCNSSLPSLIKVLIHAKMIQLAFNHCYLDHYVVDESGLDQVILMVRD